MEFLTTPDIGAASRWTPSANPPLSSAPAPASVSAPSSSVRPLNSVPPGTHTIPLSNPNHSQFPTPSPTHQNPVATPQHPLQASTPYFANLDRAGIKNSFQSLFSPNPNVAATPAMLSRPAAPGITPFINGLQTPGLVAPPTGVLPNYPPMRSPHAIPTSSPNHDAVLSTPYLREAAKEAVRREFMNMPTYVAPNDVATAPGERVVPGNEFASPTRPPIQVMTKTGSTAPSPVHMSQVTPQNGDAKVPSSASPVVSHGQKPSSPDTSKPTNKDDQSQHVNQQFPVQPYFVQHAQPPPGMVMIGQHGMMMGPPPGAIYAPPPGVMMIPGGQPMMPQGMMMSAPHPVMRQTGPPVKPETASERKARIEHEKQELIREFKKKTREAALVRFRQKRRERRFGKLIRYDCRKKLADARPRVKGRFVRIKADEDDLSEGPQVVPNLER